MAERVVETEEEEEEREKIQEIIDIVIEIDITEHKTDTEINVTSTVNIQLWKNGKNVIITKFKVVVFHRNPNNERVIILEIAVNSHRT